MSIQEAELAKATMHGKLISGRPLVVRFASDKCNVDSTDPVKNTSQSKKRGSSSSGSSQVDRNLKIAAIKSKLKSLEEENCSSKKMKLSEHPSVNTVAPSSKRSSEAD